MRLGAQVSVAGGLHNAFENGVAIGADTLMFYTRSNRQWRAKPISDEDAALYKETAEAHAGRIYPAVVHANYLMNLASPEPDKWELSYKAFLDEVNRTAQLGIELMVMHPGSHMEAGEEAGLKRIIHGLTEGLAETAASAPGVVVCLETMAGQGTNLGHRFEHLATLLAEVPHGGRLAVCFDTCHVFTAGYDIRTPDAYEKTMAAFDRVVGLDQIKCFHFNDSKYDLDTRRDRHEHIGRGFIGAQGFANFVNDPRWTHHPAHLETPKTEEDENGQTIEMDPVNLETLRALITSQ